MPCSPAGGRLQNGEPQVLVVKANFRRVFSPDFSQVVHVLALSNWFPPTEGIGCYPACLIR